MFQFPARPVALVDPAVALGVALSASVAGEVRRPEKK